MTVLATLPSRRVSSEGLDRDAYYLALDGVTRYGLTTAVKAIMQNALGHAFFPSPPELRGEIDKAMEWHERQRQKELRIKRENEEFERQSGVHRPPLTDEQRERQRKRMERFYHSIGASEEAGHADFVAQMEAKYGREELAKVPENPDFARRMGRKA